MRSGAIDVPSRTRTIWGYVAGNGTITIPGSVDGSVQRSATGIYIIRFLRPFAFSPAVTFLGYTLQYIPVLNSIGADSMSVVWSAASGGAGADTPFTFTATGRVAS